MGQVYRARDVRLSRTVALKVVAPDLAGKREALVRLRREAETASRLNHPNLVTIFDIGESGEGQIFIAMELIEGVSLRNWLSSPHTEIKTAEVMTQAAEGLAAAHACGVIHRDVKPDNIMVATNGYAKVVDFGLAKARLSSPPGDDASTDFRTSDGTIVGTVLYMAPEQLRGEPLEPSCDVFSLGCVLHEALSRRPPFAALAQADTIARILHEAPPPLPAGVDPRLSALVMRMLEKTPRGRPTMQEVAAELRAVARTSEQRTAIMNVGQRPRRERFALLATVLALTLVTIVFTWSRFDARLQSQPAVSPRPADARVAEVYAKAMFFASDRKWPVQDQSIPLLEDVVQRDPNFLPARIELAYQYARRAFNNDPDRSWEQKAFVEADRILRIDPRSPAGHHVMANLKWTKARGFALEDSLREFERALAADPAYKPARAGRAGLLMHVGLLEDALADYQMLRNSGAAEEEDLMRVARIHLWRGETATALREFREHAPGTWQIAVALNELGRNDEALAFIEGELATRPTDGDLHSTHALVLTGQKRYAEAEQAIARAYELGEESSHFHHSLYNVACAWARMGNAQKAVEALDRVSREGMPCYPLFARDPMLDPIRRDPRFVQFLADSRSAWEARRQTLAKLR